MPNAIHETSSTYHPALPPHAPAPLPTPWVVDTFSITTQPTTPRTRPPPHLTSGSPDHESPPETPPVRPLQAQDGLLPPGPCMSPSTPPNRRAPRSGRPPDPPPTGHRAITPGRPGSSHPS